jgi:Protein ChrB, N-terminal
MAASWLVLMVSLPPHPSSLRVRVWRKLRALGAISLRKSMYLLPPTPDNFERFQWLSQEVQKDGGEATFLSVDNIENMKRAEVVRLFQCGTRTIAPWWSGTERSRVASTGRVGPRAPRGETRSWLG